MRKANDTARPDPKLDPLNLMNSSAPEDREPETASDAPARLQPVTKPEAAAHLDPITGEPHAHPVGVGVGALGAGATAAALIGAIAGPIGAVIGAAIGAVAGGLAGKEVAEASEPGVGAAATETVGVNTTTPVGRAADAPIPAAAAEPVNAPVNYSGTGHVSAASLVKEDVTAAADPIEEDLARQGAPQTVPFSASALPGDEMAEHRSPLTPADTDVLVAGVPNDVPQADEPKGLLNHDLLFEHGDTASDATIRTHAYYNYLDRQHSGQAGDELDDWVKAEHNVLKG